MPDRLLYFVVLRCCFAVLKLAALVRITAKPELDCSGFIEFSCLHHGKSVSTERAQPFLVSAFEKCRCPRQCVCAKGEQWRATMNDAQILRLVCPFHVTP